jgi:hypothetical protein
VVGVENFSCGWVIGRALAVSDPVDQASARRFVGRFLKEETLSRWGEGSFLTFLLIVF